MFSFVAWTFWITMLHVTNSTIMLYSSLVINASVGRPFFSPEAVLLLFNTKNRDLWPDPIFCARAEYLFCVLSQSDLSDLMGSL